MIKLTSRANCHVPIIVAICLLQPAEAMCLNHVSPSGVAFQWSAPDWQLVDSMGVSRGKVDTTTIWVRMTDAILPTNAILAENQLSALSLNDARSYFGFYRLSVTDAFCMTVYDAAEACSLFSQVQFGFLGQLAADPGDRKRLIYGVLPDSPETPDDGGRQ